MESPCECGIEPPGSISHGVSRNVIPDVELTAICGRAFLTDIKVENGWCRIWRGGGGVVKRHDEHPRSVYGTHVFLAPFLLSDY